MGWIRFQNSSSYYTRTRSVYICTSKSGEVFEKENWSCDCFGFFIRECISVRWTHSLVKKETEEKISKLYTEHKLLWKFELFTCRVHANGFYGTFFLRLEHRFSSYTYLTRTESIGEKIRNERLLLSGMYSEFNKIFVAFVTRREHTKKKNLLLTKVRKSEPAKAKTVFNFRVLISLLVCMLHYTYLQLVTWLVFNW